MLIFDSRGHYEIREMLEELGEECLVENLDSADVLFLDHQSRQVGVELKTTDDLIASIRWSKVHTAANVGTKRPGRLFAQARRMLSDYDIAILLPFGLLTCSKDGLCRTWTGIKRKTEGWPTYPQVMSALLSLMGHGVLVMPVQPNEYWAAQTLRSMYHWFQKADHKSFLQRSRPFTFGSPDMVQAIHMLTGIPGVDVSLAKRLLKSFGSPLRVLTATEEELRQVRGIGKVLAKRICHAARVEYQSEE